MATAQEKNTRPFLLAGIAAGIIFFIVPTIEIFARPGFDISRHAISMLSLGERGWLMAATFLLAGLLTLLCAIGMRRALDRRAGGRWGPILVGAYGIGLIIAGIFPAPAGLGFPPGTPADMEPVMTASAIMHSIAFMVAFTSLILACFVFARHFSKVDTRGWTIFSAATGLAIPALIASGMSGVIVPGVAFYWAAMLAWLWVAAVVRNLTVRIGAAA